VFTLFSVGLTTLAVLVANLPPVVLIRVVQIFPRIFEKIEMTPVVLSKALGEDDLRKKPEAKHLMTLSL
jgi:hypothetical protein